VRQNTVLSVVILAILAGVLIYLYLSRSRKDGSSEEIDYLMSRGEYITRRLSGDLKMVAPDRSKRVNIHYYVNYVKRFAAGVQPFLVLEVVYKSKKDFEVLDPRFSGFIDEVWSKDRHMHIHLLPVLEHSILNNGIQQ